MIVRVHSEGFFTLDAITSKKLEFQELVKRLNELEQKIAATGDEGNILQSLHTDLLDTRQQVEELELQQSNTSNMTANIQRNVLTKLNHLESRLDAIRDAHAQLTQTISDCRKQTEYPTKTEATNLTAEQEKMLEEKIVKFLSEILNAESATISEGGGEKWSEVREYLVSGLKSKQTEDVMTKEQMLLHIETTISKNLRQDIVQKEIGEELEKLFAVGADTERQVRESVLDLISKNSCPSHLITVKKAGMGILTHTFIDVLNCQKSEGCVSLLHFVPKW